MHTGPSSKNLIIVIMLINVTNALTLGFSWVDFADVDGNYFPLLFGLLMWFAVNYFLYKASTTDPGFIPK